MKSGTGKKVTKPKARLRCGRLVLVGMGVLLLVAGGFWYASIHPSGFPGGPILAPAVPTNTPSTTTTVLPKSAFTGTFALRPASTPSPATSGAPAGTPTATQIPAPALYLGTPDAEERQILFLATGGCTAMSVSTAGGGPHTVTTGPLADCASAEISPNGKRIAYVSQNDRAEVYAANVDGSGRTLVARIPLFHSLAVNAWRAIWSPNSQRIAIIMDLTDDTVDPSAPVVFDTFGGLSTVSASGGALLPIDVAGIEFPSTLSWSPDGRWLFVFDLKTPGDYVQSFALAYHEYGSHFNYVSVGNATLCFDVCHFDWASDSRRLAYIYFGEPMGAPRDLLQPGQQAIIVSELSEKEFFSKDTYIPLPAIDTQGKQFPSGPWSSRIGARWSPDGKFFLAARSIGNQLVLLGLDGTIRNTVVSLPAMPAAADWSPDGRWISFVLPGPSKESGGILGIVRPDGSDVRILAYHVAPDTIVWQ